MIKIFITKRESVQVDYRGWSNGNTTRILLFGKYKRTDVRKPHELYLDIPSLDLM